MTHTKMVISLFTTIEGPSSSREINKGYMYSIPYILHKTPIFSPQWETMAGFTIRQIERDKLASKIYSNL